MTLKRSVPNSVTFVCYEADGLMHITFSNAETITK